MRRKPLPIQQRVRIIQAFKRELYSRKKPGTVTDENWDARLEEQFEKLLFQQLEGAQRDARHYGGNAESAAPDLCPLCDLPQADHPPVELGGLPVKVCYGMPEGEVVVAGPETVEALRLLAETVGLLRDLDVVAAVRQLSGTIRRLREITHTGEPQLRPVESVAT